MQVASNSQAGKGPLGHTAPGLQSVFELSSIPSGPFIASAPFSEEQERLAVRGQAGQSLVAQNAQQAQLTGNARTGLPRAKEEYVQVLEALCPLFHICAAELLERLLRARSLGQIRGVILS